MTFLLQVLQQNLDRWVQEFSLVTDDSIGGLLLFSNKTADVVALQRERVADITDVGDMYTEMRAPPNSKHNLPTYVCMRGEKVEIFHSQAVRKRASQRYFEFIHLYCLH